MTMQSKSKTALVMLVAAPMFLLAGCATQAEVDELRSEVMKSQEMARTAEQKAADAAIEAQKSAEAAARAAEEATAAGKKAEGIFRTSLMK
jgi:outer membrane murein-binding lipoprotein Lpp